MSEVSKNEERMTQNGNPISPLPRSPAPSIAEAFGRLFEIIAALRAPDGCPWDREQDHRTLKKYLLEEAYETIEAIDRDDPVQLCDELGDVLLQVMLHSQIASEEGAFDVGDVIRTLSEKMIRRHPHVFGDVSVEGSSDVLRNWYEIKAAEAAQKGETDVPSSVLDGIPREYPALMKAMEVSRRAVKVGFEWERIEDVWSKVYEELDELERAASDGDRDAIGDEMGDLLFTLVNIGRWMKIDAEESLRLMLDRFTRRFRYVEERLAVEGRPVETVPLAELDALWNEAKRRGE